MSSNNNNSLKISNEKGFEDVFVFVNCNVLYFEHMSYSLLSFAVLSTDKLRRCILFKSVLKILRLKKNMRAYLKYENEERNLCKLKILLLFVFYKYPSSKHLLNLSIDDSRNVQLWRWILFTKLNFFQILPQNNGIVFDFVHNKIKTPYLMFDIISVNLKTMKQSIFWASIILIVLTYYDHNPHPTPHTKKKLMYLFLAFKNFKHFQNILDILIKASRQSYMKLWNEL